jgi:hypothetical protein
MVGDEVLTRQCPCSRAFDLGSALWDPANSTAIRRSKETRGFTQVRPPW